jgi:ArsR family transcriptional regulator
MAGKIADGSLRSLWELLRKKTNDPLVQQDIERIPQVLNARNGDSNWADSVAGDMERHYSPGRTWEATTRAIVQLLELGDVLDVASGDGVLAELLAPRARSIKCLDISQRVVDAGRKRLHNYPNVSFGLGDMHDLPVPAASADTILLMHALTYTKTPQLVFDEAFRILKPGGRLLAVTLQKHAHKNAVTAYNHLNLGFTEPELREFCTTAGLDPLTIQKTGIEKRTPHFEVLTLVAGRSTLKQQ